MKHRIYFILHLQVIQKQIKYLVLYGLMSIEAQKKELKKKKACLQANIMNFVNYRLESLLERFRPMALKVQLLNQ